MQASLLTVDSRCWAGNCLKPNLEKVLLGRLETGGGPLTGVSLVVRTQD